MFQSSLQFSALERDGRWDAEFYHAGYQALRDALLAQGAVPLNSFAKEAGRGIGPTYDPAGAVRVINSVNVRDLEISDERQSKVVLEDLRDNQNAAICHGDLMITSTGIGTLGRTFCNLTNETFLADGHITIVRLRDPAFAPYLCAFLQSPLGRAQFIQRRRGSSRQVEIYPDDILAVLVPPLPDVAKQIAMEWLEAVDDIAVSQRLYPLAEQDLLADLDWRRTQQLDTSNNYVANISALRDSDRFDSEFFSPRFVLIDQLFHRKKAVAFTDFVLAHIKGVQPASYAHDGDVVVIKSKDVVKSGINIDTCDRAKFGDVEAGQGVVQHDVLLTNMTGVGTLGRAAVAPPLSLPTVISVDVAGWRIKPDSLPVEYFALFLNSPAGTCQSLRHQTGSSGQLHLYPEHVRNFKIHVRRTHSGKVDVDWHDGLAQKVREARSARAHAATKLKSIHERLSSIIGLNPRIYRE